jgi:hypothetical protein
MEKIQGYAHLYFIGLLYSFRFKILDKLSHYFRGYSPDYAVIGFVDIDGQFLSAPGLVIPLGKPEFGYR